MVADENIGDAIVVAIALHPRVEQAYLVERLESPLLGDPIEHAEEVA